jgi:hypothetical protein
MSNAVELSKAGSLADLEVALEVADIQRPFLPAQWVLGVLVVLLEDQAVSEVVSVVALTADGDEVASEEVSKIVEVMVEAEGVLDTKGVEVSKVAGEAMEVEIVVGMVGPTAMVLPQMPQQVQEAVVVVVAVLAAAAAVMAEEGMVRALQIETVLRLVVGMTRVVAVAHMMTETPDTVAATEAMEIVKEDPVVEAAATWSR